MVQKVRLTTNNDRIMGIAMPIISYTASEVVSKRV